MELYRYDCMDLSEVDNLQEVETDLYISFGDHWHKNRIWTGYDIASITSFGTLLISYVSHYEENFTVSFYLQDSIWDSRYPFGVFPSCQLF